MADGDEVSGEALDALLLELRERFSDGADPRAVRVYLAARGYEARRIDAVLAAFSALHGSEPVEPGRSGIEAAEAPLTIVDAPEPALRVPAPHERARFTAEAWGHLLRCRASARWSMAELEMVIERAMVHTGRTYCGRRPPRAARGRRRWRPAAPTTIH